MEPIAAGATIPQVAMVWLLARSPLTLPIPPNASITHLQQNLTAEDLALTPEQLKTVDELVAVLVPSGVTRQAP